MGRVFAAVLLSLSLTAVAQTTAPTGSSSTIPARVNLDSAPTVLYGGTAPVVVAPAAPPTSIPARVNLDPLPPIIYSGNAPIMPSGPDPSVVRPLGSAEYVAVESGTITTGGVSYVTMPAAPVVSTISVADAAAQYRTSKAGTKSRVLDNHTLGTLDRNPSGLVTANELTMPQSDISPEEEAALRNAKPEYAAAGDVLDPRDLAAVEAAVRRSEMQRNAPTADSNAASTQYEQMTREAEAATASATTAALPQADVVAPSATRDEAAPQQSEAAAEAEGTNDVQRERLPESSSALPFLGLLGFIAVAGGAISILRARG